MKKYLTISALSLFAFGTVVSCTTDREVIQEVPTPVDYPQVYDVKGVNFTANNNYSYNKGFTKPMLDQDYVVVYHQSGTLTNGKPIWEPVPTTIYLQNGDEVDYNYDFSVNDFTLYLGGTNTSFTLPEFASNQTFRVVLVPAEFGKGTTNNLSKMSYDEVIQRYKIDDSKVVVLK
ncbi:hypothetical protein SAMN05660477_02940 [Soonwooa buanensis]|uniref:Uncharacterized protein n=1 Tax=Soonwooa buanensis TaxID=619805 RepID=A0A1T5GL67_9FLAO|nr:hypothetical protein [Soonwooa buanensis]SKC09090.1 hypothetical protein SAMN05660477_02940 [Soonwooa buanensis]